jgi:menaquinone-dependent protoporphyrinogen IX oxidase
MKTADVCISIGFSFRDSHLNEIFGEFLNNHKLLIVISPSAVTNVYRNLLEEEIPEKFQSYIKAGKQFSEAVKNPDIGFINKPLWKENVKEIMKEVRDIIE